MPPVRAYSKNYGSVRYWLEKAPAIPPSYSIPFLSVLHRNKVLYNFRKRGQRSIVKHNIGLEYVLLVASNSHISTALHISPALKKCKWLKKLCTGSANDHALRSFEVLF